MQPDISVVVPIYGVEKYLKQCVDSILNQTFKNVYFLGRLGDYKYYDMDKAVNRALALFDEVFAKKEKNNAA